MRFTFLTLLEVAHPVEHSFVILIGLQISTAGNHEMENSTVEHSFVILVGLQISTAGNHEMENSTLLSFLNIWQTMKHILVTS